MSVWAGRLRPLVSAARRRLSGGSVGSATARIDSCWLLGDGSVCVDGWLVDGNRQPGPLEARTVQGRHVGPWSPLLRKARPDAARHVLGDTASVVDVGCVGCVTGPIDLDSTLSIEFRTRGSVSRLPVPDLRIEAVPEEVFTGAVVDYDALSPQALAPVVGVVRNSLRPPTPISSVRYRHDSVDDAPTVAVVVPIYREFTFLRNLLFAVGSRSGSVAVVVVCDDPQIADALVSWASSWNDEVFWAPLVVVAHDRNSGFSAACNTGWQTLESEFTLLLNSDVVMSDVDSDIERLTDSLTDGVAAVAPVLLFPDGSLQHAGMELVEPADFPGFVLPGHPGKSQSADGLPRGPFEVPMLSGAAVMVHTDLLAQVGGVPPVFGRGDFEDMLLSRSLRRHGRLVVEPSVRWMHVEGVSYERHRVGGIAVTLAKSVVAGEQART